MKNLDRNIRILLESLSEGVWFVDDELTIRYANKRLSALLGYAKKEQVGRPLGDFIHGEALASVSRALAENAGTPGTLPSRIIRRKDGTDIECELRVCPHGSTKGVTQGVFVVLTDLTGWKREDEYRKIDDQIRQTQKLETLGLIAGGVAHDINNLLVTILGHADLSLLKLYPKSHLFTHISNIKTSAVRASSLTSQMLACTGKGGLTTEPVNLNELTEEMAGLLRVSISRRITLRFRFAEKLSPIEADGAQVRQVVMNLITNASEAIGEGNPGVITIETGTSPAGSSGDSQGARFVSMTITDTGCGMDSTTIDRIFEPLYTTKVRGRGLGLRVVRDILRAHKGSITVDSTPRKGTVFTVQFPVSDRPLRVSGETEKTQTGVYTGGGTILIIDDDQDVRDVTGTMLETMNFTVYKASGGCQGIDMYRQYASAMDIVIIDMTMHDMSGEDVLAQIKAIGGHPAVLVSSGYGEREVRRRFARKSVSGFIQKPYQMKTLVDKVASVMKKRR